MYSRKILILILVCIIEVNTPRSIAKAQSIDHLTCKNYLPNKKSFINENDNINNIDITSPINREKQITVTKNNISDHKRYKIDPFKKEQGRELLRASSQLGLGILLTNGIYYFIGGAEPINISMLAGPLIGNLLTKPLGNIGNKLCLLFFPSLAKPSLQKGIKLKSIYEKHKASLSNSMCGFMETSLQNYLHSIEYFDYVEKQYERAIEEVLQFPIKPKEIKQDIIPPLKSFLKNYPENVRIAVGNFIAQIIKDSKFKKLHKKGVPLMFVGPPGTGKTYLATQLGQLVGVHTQVIDISKYKAVNGHNFWMSDPERGILVDVLLGDQKSGENPANKILILDEIDKVLTKDKQGAFKHKNGPEVINFLHTLLETQETSAKLRRYNNASHDISHLKIILIANHTFSEVLGKEEAMSLESRVNVVHFDNFKDIQKLNIAHEYLTKRCEEQGINYNLVDLDIIKSIVKTDTEAGYKGVRVMLNVIEQYLRILEQGTLIGEIADVPPLVFNVKEEYNRIKQNDF
jgi:type II secretory pathway predicted ATPase ExeA